MATPVLICDDSALARKQLARTLPADWNVDVSFAQNGIEALAAIRAGKGDVLFLDLNMPGMDGYEVLQTIRQERLNTRVIVVSGDVQPEAIQRVMAMGALVFLKKPVVAEQLAQTLLRFGLHGGRSTGAQAGEKIAPSTDSGDAAIDYWDCYREVANVAMGRAADMLARLLEIFVLMPLPHVNMLTRGELSMALAQAGEKAKATAICQGFIGSGIAGEALLIFHESCLSDIAALLNYHDEINDHIRIELLMDIAAILIGACLKGISDQLDISFSQGQPLVLGHHVRVEDLLSHNPQHWQSILTIEMGCRIENRDVSCDLLLLFTEDSLPSLNEHVAYIAG